MKKLIVALSLMIILVSCSTPVKEVEAPKADTTCVDSVACCTVTTLTTETIVTTVTTK